MRHRIQVFLLTVAMLFLMSPVVTNTALSDAGAALSIDQGWYVPLVDEVANKVDINFRLISNGMIDPKQINVLLDLGDPTSAPFEFRTYQFSLAPDDPLSSPNVYSLVQSIPLITPRSNGRYPIVVQTAYTEGGVAKTQSFTLYVTITKGVDPNATPAPEPETTPEPELPDLGKLLQIDNGSIYPGMSRSYAEGYMPIIEGGVCRIVLPLYATDSIRFGQITATPNYGDPTTAPFEFNNIQQTIPVQNFGSGPRYLIHLALPLKSDRINGTYPLVIKTEYTGWTGKELTQDFTLYVTVSDGRDPETEDSEEPINFRPPVYVESYTVMPDMVNAGDSFRVVFTLKNASADDTVRNVKVSFKGENTELFPAGNSNTLFIDRLSKDSTEELVIDMKAMPEAKSQPHKLILSIEYEDATANTLSVEDELLVQVRQPIRMEFDEPNLAQSLNAGDTVSMSMQVRNMGKSTISNVLVKLDVPGLLPDSSAFLGNMDAGTSKNAEMLIFVGMKTMIADGGAESPDKEKYGYTSGKMHISYEDEYGTEYSEEIEISTVINAPLIIASNPDPEPEQPRAGQWWISVAIGGILFASGLTAFLLRKRHRRIQVQLDEVD